MKNMAPPMSGMPVYYEDADKPIDIKYYFFLFKKNFYVIFTFLIITVTLAGIYASKIPDKYASMAQLIIEQPKQNWQSESQIIPGAAESLSEDYYNTQIEIIVSQAVLSQVVDDLSLKKYFGIDDQNTVIKRVAGMISVERVRRSRIFQIQAESSDPVLAQKLANSVARAYIKKNFEDLLYYTREIVNWLPKDGSPDETITIEDPLGRVKEVSRKELIESLPAIRTDPTLNSLIERKNQLEADMELLLKQYRHKHPLVVKQRSQVDFIEQSIDSERKRIIQGLKYQAEGKHQVSPARLLEEAKLPTSPVPSKRLYIILLAAIAELMLAMMIIFLLDYFDDSVRSAEDFERRGLSLPFLGPVFLVKGQQKKKDKKRYLISEAPKENTEIIESFRYLRVAINFSAPPETLKNIVVSSCMPGEGKSFVAANLAISLAMDGNKTLLIDGDLRRPVVHKSFNMENVSGLSNYLTSNIDIDAITKDSPVENLHVIPSGPISPNPGEILGSERMKKFIKEIHEKYDRIVIDCPPLTGLGDGYVVGNMIGHIIMVIAAGKTPASLIRRTQEQLEKAGVKIIGAILNMVDIEKERYGGYYKYYYHTYTRYYRNDKTE